MSTKLPVESVVIVDGQLGPPPREPRAVDKLYGSTKIGGGRAQRMTFDRFKAIAAGIDLRMFPMPIEVTVEEDASRMVTKVIVNYKAAAREDGRPTTITSRRMYPWGDLEHKTDDDVVDLLFNEVKGAVLHELEEAFLVHGKRVRDPHWNDGPVDIGEQPPYVMPDPLPPPLPRMEFPPGERRIKIGGFKRPAMSFAAWGQIPEGDLHVPVYEYLTTGELVGEPKPEPKKAEPAPAPKEPA